MSMCSQVTSKSLSLSLRFAQEPDELWQAGLDGFSPHGRPDQSTALFDRDAGKSPSWYQKAKCHKATAPLDKSMSLCELSQWIGIHSR